MTCTDAKWQLSSDAYSFCPQLAGFKSMDQLNNPYSSYKTATTFFGSTIRYGYTKLMNEHFKIELQRRLNAEGSSVIVLSVMPGLVGTENAVAKFPWWMKPMAAFSRSLTDGATSALFGAADPEVRRQRERYECAYLGSDGSIVKTTAQATDPELAADLWCLTQEIVDKIIAGQM